MAFSKRYIAIVDGYSAGNLLAPEFQKRGLSVVHVQSTETVWPILLPSFRPQDYVENFPFSGNLEPLLEKLRRYPLEAVLAGTETGVELADQISQRLGLRGNGLELSAARRNKFLMVEAVRHYGLDVAAQAEVDSADECVRWAEDHEISQVVVKPLKSAGTDSVAICSSPDQIRTAARAILGQINMLGILNTSVLVQEYLVGTEYFINTVSHSGRHHFTEIWQYQKRSINGRDCVYDRNLLLPHNGPIQDSLRQYVTGVLSALEINWGPAHTEVIMTSKGPRLVESGARLDGLSVPPLNQECIGYGPLDLTADTYVNAEAFQRKASAPYSLKKQSQTVYLTSYQEGTVAAIPGEDLLKSLPSFFQMKIRVKPGGAIKKTTDYFTAPGFLTLIHPDAKLIEQDYETIRCLEREGKIFTLV